MTYSTADRRVVLPEWVMPYLLEYGSRFDCDDLPTILGRVIADHRMAGLAAATPATATAATPSAPSQAIAPVPEPTASRFKI
ncbi:hypothetical protein H6F67_27240 [Microcoleus sp. FACHB-1515]|uniref:hypothetical protein n=1 Tax=Cyanophyceae TaxID=3028117 RepID=UPI001689BFD6|nr:hypothetical protein [Microcoleus sp. FACHB-1515]MBD2093534.1 hypothetical protein [Microcoleus sp. FACHB-1515]